MIVLSIEWVNLPVTSPARSSTAREHFGYATCRNSDTPRFCLRGYELTSYSSRCPGLRLLIGVNNTNLQIGKQEVSNKKTSQRNLPGSLGGQCLASVLERQDYITLLASL